MFLPNDDKVLKDLNVKYFVANICFCSKFISLWFFLKIDSRSSGLEKSENIHTRQKSWVYTDNKQYINKKDQIKSQTLSLCGDSHFYKIQPTKQN